MYLDQAVVFVVIQVFPCALFPVLRMRLNGSPIDAICTSLPGLSFLSARALDTSFSLCSLQSWSSRRSRYSWGSLISVLSITSIPPRDPWGTRLAMCAGLTCAAEGRLLWINRQFIWYKAKIINLSNRILYGQDMGYIVTCEKGDTSNLLRIS